MNDPVAPERKPLCGKWALFAVLAALAAFMYGIIMIKIANYGL